MLKRLTITVSLCIIVFTVHVFPPLSLVKPLTKEIVGLKWNWIWAIDCFIVAFVFCRVTRTKYLFAPYSKLETILLFGVGIILGIILQGTFCLLGLRRKFSFEGIEMETLVYQSVVSFTEEILFRGTFQTYLAGQMSEKSSSEIRRSIASGLIISLVFGLVHGVNPVIFNSAPFNFWWFASTFALSAVAGVSYAISPYVVLPAGAHLSYNYVASFF